MICKSFYMANISILRMHTHTCLYAYVAIERHIINIYTSTLRVHAYKYKHFNICMYRVIYTCMYEHLGKIY